MMTTQDGTELDDYIYGGGMGDTGSVILVGSTNGDWEKPNRGGEDFAAVKLNTTDGSILWKWQVRHWYTTLTEYWACSQVLV